MTIEEAERIAYVVDQDGCGCHGCLEQQCFRLNVTFPEFDWQLREGGIMVTAKQGPPPVLAGDKDASYVGTP